ncbi:hypothetical protein BH11CYA1_BH11CYA1_41160 [soil metagenome]
MTKKLEQLNATAERLILAKDYENGIKTLLKANEVAEKSGNVLHRFETLNDLGSAYSRAGQPQKALVEYTRAMNLCVFADLGAFSAGVCLASTSHVYFDLQMISECEETAKKYPGFNSQISVETIISKIVALPEDMKAEYEYELAALIKLKEN